jgi:hypothetical protein
MQCVDNDEPMELYMSMSATYWSPNNGCASTQFDKHAKPSRKIIVFFVFELTSPSEFKNWITITHNNNNNAKSKQ